MMSSLPSTDSLDKYAAGDINIAQPQLFRDGAVAQIYKRLCNEPPVHYCANGDYRPYWSITRYAEIEAIALDTSTFSPDIRYGGVSIARDLPAQKKSMAIWCC